MERDLKLSDAVNEKINELEDAIKAVLEDQRKTGEWKDHYISSLYQTLVSIDLLRNKLK